MDESKWKGELKEAKKVMLEGDRKLKGLKEELKEAKQAQKYGVKTSVKKDKKEKKE